MGENTVCGETRTVFREDEPAMVHPHPTHRGGPALSKLAKVQGARRYDGSCAMRLSLSSWTSFLSELIAQAQAEVTANDARLRVRGIVVHSCVGGWINRRRAIQEVLDGSRHGQLFGDLVAAREVDVDERRDVAVGRKRIPVGARVQTGRRRRDLSTRRNHAVRLVLS